MELDMERKSVWRCGPFSLPSGIGIYENDDMGADKMDSIGLEKTLALPSGCHCRIRVLPSLPNR